MSDADPFELCGTSIDGKYRVLSVVGQGGFGVVYKGVHAGFEAPVAIKCLKLPPHFDLRAQEALVQQLREEGRMLLRLSQRTPGILQALDVGSFTTPGGARVPYLVLEWLDGRTLADEIHARGPRPLREAVGLLDPAARALAVAHEEKIAHRDIKPENMFCIAPGGRPTIKILDFGIAKLLGEAASPSSGTAMHGPSMFTPTYAAPEQFDKKRGATGPWTDVFAFALVLVELVTGRQALEGNGIFALYHASSNPAERPTLRTRGAEVPELVDRVVERALHPDPSLRYSDLGSFWQALEGAMAAVGETPIRPASLSGPQPMMGSRPDIESAPTMVQMPGLGTTGQPTVPGAVTGASGGMAPPMTQPNATTAQSAVAPSPSRGPWIALAGLVIAVAGLGVAFRGRLLPHSQSQAPSASAPVASTEVPVSQNPAAAGLYREAMQGWHDGSQDRASRDMERAVGLDRELGAGHLRLALWYMMMGNTAGKQVEAQDHYQKALLDRQKLGESDKGLLMAVEPYLRQPWDLDEWGKKMAELSARFPDDVEILVYLGASHLAQLQPDAAIAVYERALQKDPLLLAARVAEADSLWMKGDPEGQLKVYAECLKALPSATQCLLKRLTLQAQLGRCPAMREDAVRLHNIDAKSAAAERQLALALHANGVPTESVLEALRRSWTHVDAADRSRTELEDQAALAAISGDFAGAQRHLEEWQAAVKDKPDQQSHATPAQHLAELFAEIGQAKKAGEAAGVYLRRMSSWTEPQIGAQTVVFLAHQLRAGLVQRPDFEMKRGEAVTYFKEKWTGAGRKLDDDFAWLSWTVTYGSAVATEDDARLAAGTMPKQKSRAVENGRWQNIDFTAGRAYALSGDFAHAIPPLRRFADSCLALTDPVPRTQAQLYLGLALEHTGDADGARVAYRKVIERWGKATPPSLTAQKARARLLALGGDKKR